MKKYLLIALILIATKSEEAEGQIIYSETFSSANGTTSTGNYSSTCPSCASGDWFEVRSGRFSAQDVNNWAYWTSSNFSTAPCDAGKRVSITVDFLEWGDNEGPACSCGINQDYLDLYYSTNNGGSWTIGAEDWNGDGQAGHTLTGDSRNGVFTDLDWGNTNSTSQSNAAGWTVNEPSIVAPTQIRVRIEARTTSGSEGLAFDNLIIECVSTLPIELLNFTAHLFEEKGYLNWTTASEQDNAYFEIQRSSDGENFEKIGRIEGQGTTNYPMDYQFEDDQIKPGVNYYRFMQVDLNGEYHYSPVRIIEYFPSIEFEIADIIYDSNENALGIYLENSIPYADYNVSIIDMQGRIVQNQTLTGSTIYFENLDLSSGVYAIVVSNGAKTISEKIAVSR